MNRPDTVLLVRYVRAMCPQQRFDEYTPDAWYDILAPYSLDDCRTAVQAIVTRGQAFVGVGEIVAEVKLIRSRRLESADLALPPADPAREGEYRQALKAITRRIGDGVVLPLRAIPAGKADRGPSSAYQETREEMDARRKAAALARARAELPPAEAQSCDAGHLLDPDGTCRICTALNESETA